VRLGSWESVPAPVLCRAPFGLTVHPEAAAANSLLRVMGSGHRVNPWPRFVQASSFQTKPGLG